MTKVFLPVPANIGDMSRGERVVTVRGEISPKDLGITLTHEHLLVDCSFYINFYAPPKEQWKRDILLNQPVTLENLWVVRRELFASRDNMIVGDPDLLVEELRYYKEAGGTSLVDLTPIGIGADPKAAKSISEKTGLNIVYGCSFYIEPSHPKYVAEKTADELAKDFVGYVEKGFGDTGIRAGIIGEIGTGPVVTTQEQKVLSAAVKAHAKIGAPINIHLANIRGKNGPRVARMMKKEGVNMEKLILSHMDMKIKNFAHLKAALDTGAFIEYDGFGEEDYVESLDYLPPRDRERVASLVKLIDKGYVDQLLLSQDTCRKTMLKKYGGQGFDHILRNIIPMMKKEGISDREIRTMMVSNPARFLAF